MTYTLTIQIGNSDNKLTQEEEWSNFVGAVQQALWRDTHIHFSGGSRVDAPWQNFCWVIECNEAEKERIVKSLRSIRQYYRQGSVAVTAVTADTTEFI